MNDKRDSRGRQGCSQDELALLLQDALSAAVGWTVPPPEIFSVPATLGGANWGVDVSQLDDRLLAVVRRFQGRYELKPKLEKHSTRHFLKNVVRLWRRGKRLYV